MTLTRVDLGQRIAKAREEATLSQADLAQIVELNQSAISRIEGGLRGVDSLELAAIAYALDVSVIDLLETRPLAQELRIAARSQAVADAAALERAIDRVVDIVRLDQMLSELGLPSAEARAPLEEGPPPGKAIDHGRQLARAVRDAWGLGDDPLPDLFSLVEDRARVGVLLESLGGGLDGLFARTDDVSLILVDSSVTLGRQRFTVSHELCHCLLGEGELVLVDERIFGHRDPPEIRANAFAAHFLMPEEGVDRYVGDRTIDELVVMELQYTFGVSLDSLLWHLVNLRRIDGDRRDDLARRGARALAYRCGYGSEWERQEAERDVRRPPRPLVTRTLAAYEQGRLGVEVVARLVGRDDPEELRGELEAFGIGHDSRWWESSAPA